MNGTGSNAVAAQAKQSSVAKLFLRAPAGFINRAEKEKQTLALNSQNKAVYIFFVALS
ncbi:hypothetical protein [Pontibacter brevis]